VDPSFRPVKLGIPNNVLPAVVEQVRGFGLLRSLSYHTMYRRLAPYIPHPLRRFATGLAVRRVRPADVDTRTAQAFLRPEQQRQTEELAGLLNRGFPEWRTLYAQTDQPMIATRVAVRGS